MPDSDDVANAPAAPSNGQWRAVFVGPHGVRAGWRLLIFLAILVILVLAASPLQPELVRPVTEGFTTRNVIVAELIQFAIVLIATLVMGRFEHRSLADYGLPFRLILRKEFWAGALWGFVMLSVIIAMMTATHAYSPGTLALAPLDIVKYGVLWALAFLMVGFFEEFTFRGYAQFTLTNGLGFWPAATITCILFAAAHHSNPGESWVGLVEIVLIALFLCMALRRTGNLWFAIGWHMAFDWGESFFYSTPDSGILAARHMLNASLMGSKWLSGGSVGPEASVFDVIVTVAGILLLAKVYPNAKYPTAKAAAAGSAPPSVATSPEGGSPFPAP